VHANKKKPKKVLTKGTREGTRKTSSQQKKRGKGQGPGFCCRILESEAKKGISKKKMKKIGTTCCGGKTKRAAGKEVFSHPHSQHSRIGKRQRNEGGPHVQKSRGGKGRGYFKIANLLRRKKRGRFGGAV